MEANLPRASTDQNLSVLQNQNSQEESLLNSSNQHMEQSESDCLEQHSHIINSGKLKSLVQKFKELVKSTQEYRLHREECLLYNELRAPLCTPDQVRASSLDTLEEDPLIWAVYTRGITDHLDDSSNKFKTQLTKQPRTLEHDSSKVTKSPVQIKKSDSKLLLSSQKMTNEKFMEEFYQFLLLRLKKKKNSTNSD